MFIIIYTPTECKNNRNDEPMVGLADLIAGAAQSYRGQNVAALKSYRNCLKRRDSAAASGATVDQHVSAFALYEMGSILCSTNVSPSYLRERYTHA